MDVTYASEAAPESAENQDFVVCGPDAVVVVDGATPAPGVPSGCVHGVAWFARALGVGVVGVLASPPRQRPLKDVLRQAIRDVRARHEDTCDLADPDSPSATVAIVRRSGRAVDHLVLGDCAVALTAAGGVTTAVQDDRLGRLRLPDAAARARLRNTDGGFWVAGTAPGAADHALTGTADADRLRSVALFTDGGCRLATDFGDDWSALVKVLATAGPRRLIAETRAAESAAGAGAPGRKRHDDATAALWRITPDRPTPEGGP